MFKCTSNISLFLFLCVSRLNMVRPLMMPSTLQLTKTNTARKNIVYVDP